MGLTPAHDQTASHNPCSIELCERPSRAGGMCQPHYSRAWYRRNRERVLNDVATWQTGHPEKARQYKLSYTITHGDQVAAYREAHREEATRRATTWNERHPELARLHAKSYRDSHQIEQRAKTQRRRARKALIPTEKVIDSKIFERDNWICQLCRDPVDQGKKWPHPLSKSIDHIIPITVTGSSHRADNLQLAHLACNSRKRNRYAEAV